MTLPCWPRSTVVCIATGPSLTAADVAFCRDKARVVVINDAWKLAPWADVLYSSDQRWYPFHRWVPEFSGLKVAMGVTHTGVVTLKYTGESGVEWSRDGLRALRNSGGAAINLAVHLGAARVVLLGYDMGATGCGHFFGSHPRGLSTTTDQLYRRFRAAMATMVAPLQQRGITVVNCTRQTALTCFPKIALEEALVGVPA